MKQKKPSKQKKETKEEKLNNLFTFLASIFLINIVFTVGFVIFFLGIKRVAYFPVSQQNLDTINSIISNGLISAQANALLQILVMFLFLRKNKKK